MKNKKLWILFISIFAVFVLGFSVYGYFITQLDSNNHDVTLSLDENSIVEVSTINQFYSAIRFYDESKDDNFNSDSLTTIASKRFTIKLTSNIKLTADALVTSNCHINLNGFELDLNGNDLTFKHLFDGLFTVYGGTIVDSSIDIVSEDEDGNEVIEPATYGKIIIDCPNACVDFNSAAIVNNENVKIVNASAEQVMNSAMKLVYSNIMNSGINDFYTTIDDISIHENIGLCPFDHSSSNGVICCYTYSDLDLIYNYFTYEDLKISYESSNENIVSKFGEIKTNGIVDLTVKIEYGSETITKVITIHSLKEDEYALASNTTLLIYLEKYYDETTSKYIFDKSFLLPKENKYLNTNYNYILNNGVQSGNEDNDFFNTSTYNNYYLVGLNKNINSMQISSTYSGTTVTTDAINVLGQASSHLDDNYSYAINIVSDLYGNQLIIKNGQITESTYSEYQLLTDYSNYSRLAGLEYGLINNNEDTYIISDYEESSPFYNQYQLLYVDKDGAVLPYISQSVFLAIKFTFKALEGQEQEVITIQIPIVYEPQTSGAGFDAFDPYYVYFNNEFNKSTTNGFTYNSFDIPLTFEAYPTYAFFIYQDNGDGTYTKMPEGELFTITLSDGNTHDSFTKDAKTVITINPYYINENNTHYVFAYIPIYENTTQGGILYYANNNSYTSLDSIQIDDVANYRYLSKLTIPGIVRYQHPTNSVVETEAFADKELYKIAYELINGYGTYIDGETFILTSSLTQYIEVVDFSSNPDTSLLTQYNYTISFGNQDNDNQINSLRGLNLLTGINKLTFANTSLLTGTTLDVEEIRYISEITYLSELNLGNTGLYDQVAGMIGFPQGDNNEVLTILSNLSNLERLYLNDNKIYDFTPLQLFTSLKYVDVSNNTFTVNVLDTGLQFLDDLINGGLTDAVNGMYGSNGSTNAAVFAQLQANDVEINGYGNGEISPEVQLILDALSSLEYQDRISNKLAIENVYSQYSTNNIYQLPNEFIVKNTDDTTRIKYVIKSISFGDPDTLVDGVYTAKTFSIYISYSWTYSSEGLFGIWSGWQVPDGMTQEQCVVTYRYQYHVTRY